jgi:predicted permease
MIEIISRIIPIIILLLIGKWLQKRQLISQETVVDFKKLVVNLSLPALLFLSFFNMDLQARYFWFVPVIFLFCLLMYFLGKVLHQALHVKGEYFPFLITGLEYGMIGVSLFGAAYGLEHLGKFAFVDLGQETYIWFVYVALLIHKRDGETNPAQLVKMFATSPVIIAILAGLALNFLGLPERIDSIPFASGLIATIELLGSVTIPLILIVVGYGIRLDIHEFVYSARVIAIRMLVSIPAALLLNRFFVRGLMGLDPAFEAAVFTLLILPPPFILTLFMKQDLEDEIHSVDNTLTLHTIVSIIVFIIYYALNPVI